MSTKKEPKNPGPSWGYQFIRFVDKLCPRPLMNILLRAGSLYGVLTMPSERKESRAFLTIALGRKASFWDTWTHFTAFSHFLVKRFRSADDFDPTFEPSEESNDRIETLVNNGKQALYGTFHFGDSDLMGFWLSNFDLSIRMLRHQVANSTDTDWLKKRFGEKVAFLWVNNPQNLLFSLKEAVGDGHSIAMKCDRVVHSSKTEVFTFFGEKRIFPFTIYYLAILFDLPVVYAFGLAKNEQTTTVYSSPIFRPNESTKKQNLANARIHFQTTLEILENLVKKDPYQWFNFVDAIPLAKDHQ